MGEWSWGTQADEEGQGPSEAGPDGDQVVSGEGGINLGFTSIGWTVPKVDGNRGAALGVDGDAEPPGTLQTLAAEPLDRLEALEALGAEPPETLEAEPPKALEAEPLSFSCRHPILYVRQ